MSRVTVGDIIRRGCNLADVPEPSGSETSNDLIDIDWALDLVNSGMAALRDELIAEYEGYLDTKGTISMEASKEYSALPDDFYKVLELYQLEGAERYQMDPFTLSELGGYTTTETDSYPRFRLVGPRVYWHPLPTADRTIEVWYIRKFERLLDKNDEIDPVIMDGWEDFVVGHLAEQVLAKEERSTKPATQLKEMARVQIRQAASGRDSGRPIVTPDVSGRYTRRRRFPVPRQ